ncbi:DNA/RNA non-specific endonuclease [Pseudoduganella chitinolytica]|uniref:Endonuclease n=1 Tax=Pseudoduganella chitinolytica TaxID=34070 RepID=A0ABY8BIG7_9BURK|nr:DNA/RNA non-specific endonuclease [Pseudoduganella chitinolytica]WEF34462.1 DNA/RNA non-specific endonuclease [Pseudoduganella chitinolytica]
MFPSLKQVLAAVLAAGLWCHGAQASQMCPQHYVGGQAPQIQGDKMARATRELCYNVFGIMHSGVTRTPLWSAEHLKANNLAAAAELSRENSFHPELQLPAAQRAELADYARSGFDRGHMAPNGDMPDRASQYQSFTLANMVPQDADNNRHIWAGIEQAVRKMAKKEGELYVITGPAFIGSELRKVGNVLVPSHLYKVVWSPRQRAGGAWFVANEADARVQTMTIAQLESRIGINLLPSLSARQKEEMLRLPKTKAGKRKHS